MNLLNILKRKIKTKKMDKEAAIRRLDALDKEARELRKIIEEPKEITDRVNTYDDVLEILHLTKSADDVKVVGFDESENKVIQAVIKKIRICKVYNEGVKLKRTDKRWYAWYKVSSGFVFNAANFGDTFTNTASASRLCLKNEALLRDFVKKFKDVDEAIVGLD